MSAPGPDIISTGIGKLTLEGAWGSLGRIHVHLGDVIVNRSSVCCKVAESTWNLYFYGEDIM